MSPARLVRVQSPLPLEVSDSDVRQYLREHHEYELLSESARAAVGESGHPRLSFVLDGVRGTTQAIVVNDDSRLLIVAIHRNDDAWLHYLLRLRDGVWTVGSTAIVGLDTAIADQVDVVRLLALLIK